MLVPIAHSGLVHPQVFFQSYILTFNALLSGHRTISAPLEIWADWVSEVRMRVRRAQCLASL